MALVMVVWITSVVGSAVGVAMIVDDSTTTESSEVTCDVCTIVVVVGVALAWLV